MHEEMRSRLKKNRRITRLRNYINLIFRVDPRTYVHVHIIRVCLPDWLNSEIMIKSVASHPKPYAVSTIADAFASTLRN